MKVDMVVLSMWNCVVREGKSSRKAYSTSCIVKFGRQASNVQDGISKNVGVCNYT